MITQTSITNMNKVFSKGLWLIPFIMGFMTLGMNYTKEGTDLVGQVYTLSFLANDNPLELLLNRLSPHHGPYYAIYAYLYSVFKISPIAYIGLIAFLYYIVVLCILKQWIVRFSIGSLFGSDYTRLCIITICAFSPIYICIARNLLAITIFLIALSFIWNRKIIIGIALAILSYMTHEGMLLIIAVVVCAILLKVFVLPRFRNIQFRNIVIVTTCLVLLVLGPVIFSLVGNYAMSNDITSDKYNDIYISAEAGDGAFKYVLILSMLGTLYALLISSIKNHSNDIINVICITGLFFVCALFNQKIFYVQRLLMFLPVFIGCSLFDIYQTRSLHFKLNNIDSILLLSVPTIMFAQLFFWRSTFFSFL